MFIQKVGFCILNLPLFTTEKDILLNKLQQILPSIFLADNGLVTICDYSRTDYLGTDYLRTDCWRTNL